ncbi:uncharacterized protein SOCG_03965 [Schizosaccharomyces octosporus yFS286]|uniref:Uncharacterized protein n=1 Tax=Schizosaccharomyces octosporus (strain yFS286) TaxID=483514 RepID=S9PX39_SCHOY|nr:uncharacterized protein SOCG_03965 [Schizosaccharomyces octosporus yFS286]EPX72033.1 hypothetical protein SOCG_03965 [Schizosaccharomyces octosporus yFS286]
MKQSENPSEEVVPLHPGNPLPSADDDSKRRLWRSLRNRANDLEDLLILFATLYAMIVGLTSLGYSVNSMMDGPNDYTAYYIALIPSIICGLYHLIPVYIYTQPIVVEIEVDSIPMEDLPRTHDPK